MRKALSLDGALKLHSNRLSDLRTSRRMICQARHRVLSFEKEQLHSYQELYDSLASDKTEVIYSATKNIRVISENFALKSYIPEEFLAAGLLSKSISILSSNNRHIQYEILWTLINISSIPDGCDSLVALGYLEALVRCMNSRSQNKSLALWCLTNFLCWKKISAENFEIVKQMSISAIETLLTESTAIWSLKCCCSYFQEENTQGKQHFQQMIFNSRSILFSLLGNDATTFDVLEIIRCCPDVIDNAVVNRLWELFPTSNEEIQLSIISIFEVMETIDFGVIKALFEQYCISSIFQLVLLNVSISVLKRTFLLIGHITTTNPTLITFLTPQHLQVFFKSILVISDVSYREQMSFLVFHLISQQSLLPTLIQLDETINVLLLLSSLSLELFCNVIQALCVLLEFLIANQIPINLKQQINEILSRTFLGQVPESIQLQMQHIHSIISQY
ncbi:Importin alpha [Entamoeba marina]